MNFETNMLNNIEACIFDLDGTVIDSMWVWSAIDTEYLAKYGYDVPKDMQADIEGASMREVAIYFKDRFNLSDDLDTIINDWNEMAIYKYGHSVTLKPHIKEFFEFLKSRNIKIGLFTSNSLVLANAALDGLDVHKYFDVITAGCGDIKGKPEPDGYLLTADKLLVPYDKCLVFEDLTQGIKAGINAGMKTCAVKDEYSEYQLEEKIKLADYFIEDYYEVFKN